MSRIYSFGGKKSGGPGYGQMIARLKDDLKTIGDDLFDRAVFLAIEGVWKEWYEEQAAGLEQALTEEMLFDSGDSNVAALITLVRALHNTMTVLNPNNDRQVKSGPGKD